MKINIKTTSVELSPAIHDYLNKKVAAFEKLISKDDESAAINVILAKISRHHQKGDIFKIEMNLHISGKVFQASSEGEDLYSVMDIVKDEIVKELKTYKDKKVSLIKRGGSKIKNSLKGISKN